MRGLRRASEAEMVALFLRCDLGAARFQAGLRAELERAGLPERIVTDPRLEDETENLARRRVLERHHGYGESTGLFDGFPSDVRWEWMAIAPQELARVRYVDYDYWVELSGGSRLATDAAPLVRAGVAPLGVPGDWALNLARPLVEGVRFPPLILVTDGRPDGLVVLEGHARLTAYMLEPRALPPEVEVLVGTSPEMSRWGLY
jgi:hypothetical protein